MEAGERNRRITEQKEQLVSSLETHIAALEELATTTNFDFDVATDVHPHLIEDTAAGREQLKKWQDIYAALGDGPKSMVTLRWVSGLKPGCYGFGAKPEYETKSLWMHIYESVSMEDIVFMKGDGDTPPSVIISQPHDALAIAPGQMLVKEMRADDAVLYEPAPTPGYMLWHQSTDAYPREFAAQNEAFGFGGTIREAYKDIDISLDDNLGIPAALTISRFAFDKIRRQNLANKE